MLVMPWQCKLGQFLGYLQARTSISALCNASSSSSICTTDINLPKCGFWASSTTQLEKRHNLSLCILSKDIQRYDGVE